MENVAKVILALARAPLLEEDVYVYIWRNPYYAERPYIENLCALPALWLGSWRWQYMVHLDAICWERAIMPPRFRYLEPLRSVYWIQPVRWERRSLSALGRFLPYHMCFCYNLG